MSVRPVKKRAQEYCEVSLDMYPLSIFHNRQIPKKRSLSLAILQWTAYVEDIVFDRGASNVIFRNDLVATTNRILINE